MKVLVIEDNLGIASAVKRTLEENYLVDLCETGEEGLIQARTNIYDVIILDLKLPDLTGEKICKQIRNANVSAPVIILTGETRVHTKIELLNMGADDYITKPFNVQELKARVGVAMRHTHNNSPKGILIVGRLKLNPLSRRVSIDGVTIVLRRKEFDILEYLMRNQGQALTRSMIMDHIWETDDDLWANVIDVHIKHLRDKIDRTFNLKLIHTVHGIGYKIVSDGFL